MSMAIPFFVWSAAATEECVWETLAGILSTGAVSSTKEGTGSQSSRQASPSLGKPMVALALFSL